MEIKHTPGPWEVKHSCGAAIKVFGGPHIRSGKRIVAWPDFPGVSENDASEANARLIAAAPDLLAALKALFDNCAMPHKYWGENSNLHEADAAIKAGQAAIARAEGK